MQNESNPMHKKYHGSEWMMLNAIRNIVRWRRRNGVVECNILRRPSNHFCQPIRYDLQLIRWHRWNRNSCLDYGLGRRENDMPRQATRSSSGSRPTLRRILFVTWRTLFVTWTPSFRSQTLNGPFSAGSKPNLATRTPLESAWRDLQIPHSSRDLNFQTFAMFSTFTSKCWRKSR